MAINAFNGLNRLFRGFFNGFKSKGLKKVTEEQTTEVTFEKKIIDKRLTEVTFESNDAQL